MITHLRFRLVTFVALALAVIAVSVQFSPTPAGAVTGLAVSDLDHGVSATDLANALVGNGVTVSNVTYTGTNRAAGKFTSGDSSIVGFNAGIVLDSGKVQTYNGDPACEKGVEGPNACNEGDATGNNDTEFGLPGDSNLTALSGFDTFDASVLQFDFTPAFSTVQFKYVFSSDEYSDYANSEFNDVFGFFVNGTNCALVPGTSEPVSINTINNGNDDGGDTTPHHANLFRDNVRPSPTINTEMDGLTTVLTCNANVNAGQTNHMKLAIADASDEALDSAVFLQSGSLVSGTQVSTSLSGGGQSGPTITVPAGTAVKDSATLSGVNASTASGSVTYSVYSDNQCSNKVGDGGTKTVSNGAVPDSDTVTFNSGGPFYWQASYSGDELNNASKSTCGAEVETLSGGPTSTPTTPATATATSIPCGTDEQPTCTPTPIPQVNVRTATPTRTAAAAATATAVPSTPTAVTTVLGAAVAPPAGGTGAGLVAPNNGSGPDAGSSHQSILWLALLAAAVLVAGAGLTWRGVQRRR